MNKILIETSLPQIQYFREFLDFVVDNTPSPERDPTVRLIFLPLHLSFVANQQFPTSFNFFKIVSLLCFILFSFVVFCCD